MKSKHDYYNHENIRLLMTFKSGFLSRRKYSGKKLNLCLLGGKLFLKKLNKREGGS